MITIRKAQANDACQLKDLYDNHLASPPQTEEQNMEKWREMIAAFEADTSYHLLVGEINTILVSSVTLIIIKNLTNNLHPYAIIENVVTHTEYRGNHYATALMNYAGCIAKKADCYKIMLLTGSKKDSTLRFYENCGFDRNEKTAFIQPF